MATLEEITQQFEDALTGATGTTIEPGTIKPKGITSSVSGKKKLSWPEVVEKINEGIGVRQNELLPEIPQGVSAQKFYRTAAQSGLLPSGLSTFTSSPFGSFQGRMSVAQGTKPATSTPEPEIEPVAAPKSVVQTQQDYLDSSGPSIEDENTNYAPPIANPDVNLATLATLLVSPGSALSKMAMSENVYTTLDGYTPGQIEDMISMGTINDAQLAAFQQGITHMNSLGQPVDPDTGKVISLDQYASLIAARDRDSVLFKIGNKIRELFGFDPDQPGMGPGFTPGHQKDGTYITPGGQVVGGGSYSEFQDLIETDLNLAIAYRNGKGVGGIFGLSPTLSKELDEAIAKAPVYSDDTDEDLGGDFKGGGIDIGDPQPGDPDAPGEEDIGGDYDSGDYSVGGDDYGGEDGTYGFQEGGQVPQGAEADMSNLGMINEQAAQPQQGGAVSVKDDIPREADEGDYILPYETVLLVGLKDLNRYAKEAIDLAMKNGVNLKGTDLDPTDDVPIKVSNYEYHIPKMLVPFFGGGKKYLDKIRQEGLDLRKRLEEEKKPSMQEQQPMAEAQPAPAPAQAAPAPQAPMMQQGGFVDDPQKKQMQTSAAVLEADASQQSPSAYNQMQALERTRRQAQQPPMVDPMGRVVQQGFAAPQGYADGTEPGGMRLVKPFEVEQSTFDAAKRLEVDEGMSRKSVPASPDPAVDESGFTDDSVAVINEPKMPQTAAPEERATPESQKMQEAKTMMSKFRTLHPVQMMALIAMGEARGDKMEGMRAVMHVINNRTKYGTRFGKTIPEVILAKKQFSALLPDLNDPEAYKGQRYENFINMMRTDSKDKDYLKVKELAIKILQGEDEDITNGATHYYNPSVIDKPSWAKTMTPKGKIKSHLFFAINKKDGGFVNRVIDEAA